MGTSVFRVEVHVDTVSCDLILELNPLVWSAYTFLKPLISPGQY